MEFLPTSQLQQDMVASHDSSSQKHLDYNAPLLSVRRFNEQHPAHRSKLRAEDLGTPGGVPFIWEQTPGTPKKKGKHVTIQTCELSPAPRRSSRAAMESSVPEISPARSERTTLAHLLQLAATEQQSIEQTKDVASSIPAAPSLTRRFYLSSPQPDSEIEDSFSDAAETIASTEAVTATYRVSMDGNDEDYLLSHTGMASRDFIMHRFLSAAKAKTVDTSKIFQRWPVEVLRPFISSTMLSGPLSPASSTKESEPFVEEDEKTHCGYTKACGLLSLRFGNSLLHWKRSSSSSLCRRGKMESGTYKDALLSSKNEEAEGQIASKEWQAALRVHHRSSTNAVGCIVVEIDQHELILEGSESSDIRNLVKVDAQIPENLTTRNGSKYSVNETKLGTLNLQEGILAEGRIEGDRASSCFQTPRASLGEAKMAEIDSDGAILQSPGVNNGHKSSSLRQRMGGGMWVDTSNKCRHSSFLGKRVSSQEKLHEVLQQSRRGEKEQVDFADTIETWNTSQINCWPPPGITASTTERNLFKREPVLSPPLPKSPSESWLWKALQLKASTSPLTSNLPLPTSVSARKLQLEASSMVVPVTELQSTVKGST